MTYRDEHIMDETIEEFEGQHTNFIGNTHRDEASLDKALHDLLLKEVSNELV
ncbi:MAG: hypothetical protein JEZ08_01720 [Clostridiales bacterium]|nr:hypothetical protein [Clostridiales bacterium]